MDEAAIKTWSVLILLGPLLGAILAGVLGPTLLKGRTHFVVIAGVLLAVVGSFALFFQVTGQEHAEAAHVVLYQWFPVGDASFFNVEFRVDALTAIMMLVVTVISLLVVIYSRDYMRNHDDPAKGYERFFAYLGLFVFSMAALVLGGNFLLLYLGWEAVGLCSYLLIGFYYGKPSAAAAAKKAFLVNRIGDFGFGLGILLIYLTVGSLQYDVVFQRIADGLATGDIERGRVTAIALLLFCGAVGKSAQFPLYVWLPDAMEGPSPVSALIHAATMVTAGVYMIARCGAIFVESQTAMTIVASIGAFTAIFAASMALVQHDMKRILAYSTVSQLGYMFLGLGVFAAKASIFHLYTHAFFKALLFLGAGSVMHAMGNVIDLRKFSGLKRVMPWTYGTMLIGCLALAGFPLLSGFWSKDEIIHAAFNQSRFLGWIGLITALMTAFYTFRMFYRAFHGVTKVPDGVHAHESGKWMVAPLVLLSIGALFAGYAGVHIGAGGFLGLFEPHGAFQHFLEPVLAPFDRLHVETLANTHWQKYGLMYASSALSILGIVIAYALYVDSPMLPEVFARMFPGLHDALYHKYYVDEAFQAWIVEPLRKLGAACFAIDTYFIDGLVWIVTAIPRGLALILRQTQNGSLQGYGASMVVGLAIILLAVVLGAVA
jgi:NADH-quinone oxidoreductase subunit L